MKGCCGRGVGGDGDGDGGKRTSSVSCSCSTSAVISGYKNRLAGSMWSNASLVKSFKPSTKKIKL